MKHSMASFIAAILFLIGAGIIVTNPLTFEILVTGMLFISISIITSAFMIHFPVENPKKRSIKKKK